MSSIMKGIVDEGDWTGGIINWKKEVTNKHGPDVTFKKRKLPGVNGKTDTYATNSHGKVVGVYQHHNDMGRVLSETDAIKGADGKRCWKGKRYAGTENGKDKCIPVKEESETKWEVAIEYGPTANHTAKIKVSAPDADTAQSKALAKFKKKFPDRRGMVGDCTQIKEAANPAQQAAIAIAKKKKAKTNEGVFDLLKKKPAPRDNMRERLSNMSTDELRQELKDYKSRLSGARASGSLVGAAVSDYINALKTEIDKRAFNDFSANTNEGVIVGHDANDPEVAVLGGAGTMSLSRLKKKAHAEALQLADDIANGKYSASSYNMKQLHNTLNTIVAAEEEMEKLYFGEGQDLLDESIKQQLTKAALTAALALAATGQAKADVIYSYLDPASKTMKTTYQKAQIPTDASVVFKVDTDTNQTTVLKGPGSEKQGSSDENSEFTKILQLVKNKVADQLIDPDSARYGKINIYDTTSKSGATGEPVYLVVGQVNAKNRMGGYTGSVYFGMMVDKQTLSPVTDLMLDEYSEYGISAVAMRYSKAAKRGTVIYSTDPSSVKEDYTGEFAAEKTPEVNPYGGQRNRKFRGAISETPTDNPTGTSTEGGWRRTDLDEYREMSPALKAAQQNLIALRNKEKSVNVPGKRERAPRDKVELDKPKPASVLTKGGQAPNPEMDKMMADFLARGGEIKKGRPGKAPPIGRNQASKHIGGGGKYRKKSDTPGQGANYRGAAIVAVEEDTAYASGMGQGGNAGESYRKFKPKSAGTCKESSIMKGLNSESK